MIFQKKSHEKPNHVRILRKFYHLGKMANLSHICFLNMALIAEQSCTRIFPASGTYQLRQSRPDYHGDVAASLWRRTNAHAFSVSTPAQRMGQIEEVAHVVMFLLSPQASFVAGADYVVDGGYAVQ